MLPIDGLEAWNLILFVVTMQHIMLLPSPKFRKDVLQDPIGNILGSRLYGSPVSSRVDELLVFVKADRFA